MPKPSCPNAQVVILGTEEVHGEDVERPDELSPNMAGVCKFSNPIAHYITAGADFLTTPAAEPCGPPAPRDAVRTVPIARPRAACRHREGGRHRLPHGRHGPRRAKPTTSRRCGHVRRGGEHLRHAHPLQDVLHVHRPGPLLRKPAAVEAILEEMMYNSGYGKKSGQHPDGGAGVRAQGVKSDFLRGDERCEKIKNNPV